MGTVKNVWSLVPDYCSRGHRLTEKTVGFDRGYGYCRICRTERDRGNYDPAREHVRNARKYLLLKERLTAGSSVAA